MTKELFLKLITQSICFHEPFYSILFFSLIIFQKYPCIQYGVTEVTFLFQSRLHYILAY